MFLYFSKTFLKHRIKNMPDVSYIICSLIELMKLMRPLIVKVIVFVGVNNCTVMRNTITYKQ